MDIKDAILEDHSKAQSEIIAIYIGDKPDRFAELMDLVFCDDKTAAARAAWTMGHCCVDRPDLAGPWIPKLVDKLAEPRLSDGIKRNTLRILQTVDLPSKQLGPIFNLCYEFMNNPDEPAAVRIYAVTILGRICETEPDLADEVALLIKQHLPHASSGFKGRAWKILKRLGSA